MRLFLCVFVLQILERPKVYVYDTPGIMLPNIRTMDVGMKLALCGKISIIVVRRPSTSDHSFLFHYVTFSRMNTSALVP